jgi:hypothetical protein
MRQAARSRAAARAALGKSAGRQRRGGETRAMRRRTERGVGRGAEAHVASGDGTTTRHERRTQKHGASSAQETRRRKAEGSNAAQRIAAHSSAAELR